MTPTRQASPMVGSLILSMGCRPELTLATLVDLGLSDDRIGRYFNVSTATIRSLRREYGVEPPSAFPVVCAVFDRPHQVPGLSKRLSPAPRT
jgi:hypothetical protein